MPRLKTINLHPSLLPEYRGAAPIQWAIINGETKTGVTGQLINERMDAGDIVVREEILLDKLIDSGDLYQKVIPIGAGLLKKAIVLLNEKQVKPVVQDENKATYCSKLDKNIPKINWNDDAEKIHNLVRGLNPSPGTWTMINDKLIKIKKTLPVYIEKLSLSAGEIEFYDKKRLIIGTGKGLLEILYIQPETKKVMDALSFINGHHTYKNMRFY
jgi:methionyl-tRNA formyltransferase